jgi:hypothetical protein
MGICVNLTNIAPTSGKSVIRIHDEGILATISLVTNLPSPPANFEVTEVQKTRRHELINNHSL